jgi:hypothetical protein
MEKRFSERKREDTQQLFIIIMQLERGVNNSAVEFGTRRLNIVAAIYKAFNGGEKGFLFRAENCMREVGFLLQHQDN